MIDYKELLKKYIKLIEYRADYDMLGNAHEVHKNSDLTEEEYQELRKLTSEVSA